MPVYYDTQAVLPQPQWWSKTVFPRVLRSLELWLCLAAHAALVVLLRLELLQLPSTMGAFVPLELAGGLFALTLLAATMLTLSCQHWHEAMTSACVKVGEQTRLFVQELLSTFGPVEEALPLRFAAAKYALAGVYLFFFAMTGGTVTTRAWGELVAKGLLDDREVQFLAGQYAGDRLALLHVWATWAAQEAAAMPAARARLGGAEVLAGSLSRLSWALRTAAAAAQEAAGLAAMPVPYHQFQLQGTLTLASMLLLAAMAAPAAAAGAALGYVTSAAYAVVLTAVLGLHEVAVLLSDPLQEGHGFPVAATVNATADVVAQLLVAATPVAFDPRPSWRDPMHALLSQGQIERRTPPAVFASGKPNPYYWREAEPVVKGDQAPPPLLDIGCCHLDSQALPSSGEKARRHPSKLVTAPRLRQDGAGALLARLVKAVSASGSSCERSPSLARSWAGSDAADPATQSRPSDLSGAGVSWGRETTEHWLRVGGHVKVSPDAEEKSLTPPVVQRKPFCSGLPPDMPPGPPPSLGV